MLKFSTIMLIFDTQKISLLYMLCSKDIDQFLSLLFLHFARCFCLTVILEIMPTQCVKPYKTIMTAYGGEGKIESPSVEFVALPQ